MSCIGCIPESIYSFKQHYVVAFIYKTYDQIQYNDLTSRQGYAVNIDDVSFFLRGCIDANSSIDCS